MKDTSSIGAAGESAAVKFLEKNNYLILTRNYQNSLGRRLGEIDIIAKDKETGELVFVEVKTRDGARYSDTLPEENITPAKIHKLSRIANDYLRQSRLIGQAYRFDAISVWLDTQSMTAKIKHIPHL